MARAAEHGGCLILDCEGFAKLIRLDPVVLGFIKSAQHKGIRVVCSSATLIEAQHDRIKPGQFAYARSRVAVEPVSEATAVAAVDLLRQAGMAGHRCAIDAMVAATALAHPGPVTMLTSDPDDMELLCGERVEVVAV